MRYRNAFCVLFFSTIANASTVWDGVYTVPQADRGLAAYTKNCGACHMADLGGRGESPALKGDGFMDRWHDYSLRPLFGLIKTEMPPLRFRMPDTHPLPDDTYVDIISYLLKVNGFPAGTSELTLANLNAVQILGKKGAAPPPNFALVLLVGCLAQDARGRWILEGATSPVRATMPDQATAEEIQADVALGRAVGVQIHTLGRGQNWPCGSHRDGNASQRSGSKRNCCYIAHAQ